MRSQRLPSYLYGTALALAALLAAGPSVPAAAGAPDNRRLAPAECTAMVNGIRQDLQGVARRLERTANRPNARERGLKIVSRSLNEPKARGELSKLLECLTGEGVRSQD